MLWAERIKVRNEIGEVSNKIMSFVKEGKKFSFQAIKHLFRRLNKDPR